MSPPPEPLPGMPEPDQGMDPAHATPMNSTRRFSTNQTDRTDGFATPDGEEGTHPWLSGPVVGRRPPREPVGRQKGLAGSLDTRRKPITGLVFSVVGRVGSFFPDLELWKRNKEKKNPSETLPSLPSVPPRHSGHVGGTLSGRGVPPVMPEGGSYRPPSLHSSGPSCHRQRRGATTCDAAVTDDPVDTGGKSGLGHHRAPRCVGVPARPAAPSRQQTLWPGRGSRRSSGTTRRGLRPPQAGKASSTARRPGSTLLTLTSESHMGTALSGSIT
jgi:hypothetical protein